MRKSELDKLLERTVAEALGVELPVERRAAHKRPTLILPPGRRAVSRKDHRVAA